MTLIQTLNSNMSERVEVIRLYIDLLLSKNFNDILAKGTSPIATVSTQSPPELVALTLSNAFATQIKYLLSAYHCLEQTSLS